MTDFHFIRRRFIGSSDAPVLWRCGYESQSLWTLWDSKVNGSAWIPTAEEQRRLDTGHAMEPIARKWASSELGIEITKPERPYIAKVNGDEVPIGCHIDGEHNDGVSMVVDEFKWIGGWQQRLKWFDDDGEATPLGHWVQVQHQLACTGHEYALLWGMCSDELLVRKIDRDDEFIGRHLAVCLHFWRHHVETATPPEVDGSQATTDAITRRHKRHVEGETVTLPDDADDWTRHIATLDEQISNMTATRDELRNKLRAAIGDAEIGVTPGGAKWSWKTQQRKEYTVKASESRVLRLLKGKS